MGVVTSLQKQTTKVTKKYISKILYISPNVQQPQPVTLVTLLVYGPPPPSLRCKAAIDNMLQIIEAHPN